jgi:hypothetical protein
MLDKPWSSRNAENLDISLTVGVVKAEGADTVNILPTWFFTQCIQLPEDEADTSLAVLRRLIPGVYGPDMTHHALHELIRLDPMSRIYALPNVLALLANDAIDDSGWDLLMEQYFPFFSTTVDHSAGADPLMGLFGVLQPQQSTNALTDALRRSIVAVPMGVTDDDGGDIDRHAHPYADIVEHRSATAVLAVLNHLADRDPRDLAGTFEAEEESHDGSRPLRRFVDAAWQHRFGRLARLLALRLQIRLGREGDCEVLAARFVSESHGLPLLEPDMQTAVADALFNEQCGEDGARSNGEPVQRVIDELTLPRTYQILAARNGDGAATGRPLILTFLDLPDRPEVRATLSILLWQSALQHRLAQLDPFAAADWLEPAWRPRHGSQPEVVIEVPPDMADNADKHAAVENLGMSLSACAKKQPSAIHITEGLKLHWDDGCRWPVLSPWLPFKRGGLREHAYVNWRCRPALIRLVAAVDTAGLILSGCLREDVPANRYYPNITALLLHASDLLWKIPSNKNAAEPVFSQFTFTLLEATAQWVLDFCLRRVPGIGSDFFYNLCEDWHEGRDGPNADREVRQMLAEVPFPETLVRLTQDGIRESGNDLGTSVRRWREDWELIRESYQWIPPKNHRYDRANNIYLLLQRFLSDAPPDDGQKERYRERVLSRLFDPERPRFNPREFLLGFANSQPNDWRGGVAAEIDDALAAIDPRQALAVRAERIDMLCRCPQAFDDMTADWLDQLAEVLLAIDERRHSDLFILWFLTELLAQEKVIESHHLWLGIFHFLLQYGHAFQFQRLAEMLPGEAGSPDSEPPQPLSDRTLLKGIINGIIRFPLGQESGGRAAPC